MSSLLPCVLLPLIYKDYITLCLAHAVVLESNLQLCIYRESKVLIEGSVKDYSLWSMEADNDTGHYMSPRERSHHQLKEYRTPLMQNEPQEYPHV